MTGPKLTEKVVADLLRVRHTKSGNGGSGEYAFLTQFRSAAGFSTHRVFDAVSVSLWASRGFEVEVFEIKVSRSDFLAEINDPAKAEVAFERADRFSIVAPAGVVKSNELPANWGHLEVTGAGTDAAPWKLRLRKRAPLLHPERTEPTDLPREFVVSMLRAAPGAVPGGRNTIAAPSEIEAARKSGYDQGRKSGAAIAQAELDGLRLQAGRIREVCEGAGITVHQLLSHPDILDQATQRIDADRLRSILVAATSQIERAVAHIDTVSEPAA